MGEMAPSELEALEQQLRTRYRQTLQEIRDELAHEGDTRPIDLLNHEPGDSGDASLAHELAELNVATLEHHIRDIRDIESAFTRMQDGSYGVCIDCGDAIAVARLHAYPTAKRCIDCQQAHERRATQEGLTDH